MAPRIAKGKVIIGVSGGDRPDARILRRLRCDDRPSCLAVLHRAGRSVEAVRKRRDEESGGRPGTASGGSWAAAARCGTAWPTIPKPELVYVGTGNAEPWPRRSCAQSKGKDNLTSARSSPSKPDTGELKWHYQIVPGDIWDFDSVQQLMLADLTINGRRAKSSCRRTRTASIYVLDRVTGEFISGAAYSQVNWAKGIDQKTGPADRQSRSAITAPNRSRSRRAAAARTTGRRCRSIRRPG